MIYIQALLVLLSALFAFIARIKSKQLIPSYRIGLRDLHDSILTVIESNEAFFDYINQDVEKNGGITGGKESPSLPLYNTVKSTQAGLKRAKERLKESELKNVLKEVGTVGEVRLYQLASFSFAVIAFIILVVSAYLKS